MPPDMPDDTGRWLTYAEFASLRGIARESAVRMAQRNHWRRRRNNRGEALVLVPIDALPADNAGGTPGDKNDVPPDMAVGALAALEGAITLLRDQLDVANARAERAEAANVEAGRAWADERVRAGRLSEQVDALQAGIRLAEERTEAERVRADALRDRLNTMQEQLADAHAALQAAESADARAVQAEQGRDEERTRADALRAQIDVLKAEMVATGAEADRATADERMRADRLSVQVEALSTEVMRADAAGRDKELAEQGREAERARADVLRDRIEALQEQLAARQEGGDATEAIRQAEAMVDSLREAHIGEISVLKTERHRLATQIDGFAARADQAEARTDSLRARVDVLQRERDTARAEAQEAAVELRQAEAERRARGLLARLRAAWRGDDA